MKNKRAKTAIMVLVLVLLAATLSEMLIGWNPFDTGRSEDLTQGPARLQGTGTPVPATGPRAISQAMHGPARIVGRAGAPGGAAGVEGNAVPAAGWRAPLTEGSLEISAGLPPVTDLSATFDFPAEGDMHHVQGAQDPLITESWERGHAGLSDSSGLYPRSILWGGRGYSDDSTYPVRDTGPSGVGAGDVEGNEVAVVPEPATCLLVLTGLLIGVAMNRRVFFQRKGQINRR